MAIQSILVADDDPNTLTAMRSVLEPSGYAVSVATGGREAMRVASRQTVDLVITDILMPDGDGCELISALHKKFANIPVVAMSGGGCVRAEDYLLIARGFGVAGTLKKPFNHSDLLKTIKAVEKRSSQPPDRARQRVIQIWIRGLPNRRRYDALLRD